MNTVKKKTNWYDNLKEKKAMQRNKTDWFNQRKWVQVWLIFPQLLVGSSGDSWPFNSNWVIKA